MDDMQCPFEVPVTEEEEAELKIDCDIDKGLHPCCPGYNQAVSILGSPHQNFQSYQQQLSEVMGDINGFALIGAAIAGSLVFAFLGSRS